jgi:hypothetical protein
MSGMNPYTLPGFCVERNVKPNFELGINIVSYYAPTLFQENLGISQERALFVGCFLQVWYILASFLAVSSYTRSLLDIIS